MWCTDIMQEQCNTDAVTTRAVYLIEVVTVIHRVYFSQLIVDQV